MGNLLKCCCCQTKEDIISELPDEILLHILSYLPAKDILKTFALSTRWKSLRYSILYFDFHAYYCDPTVSLDRAGELNRGLGFSDCISLGSFHDMVQALPDNSIIAKFCFRCPLLPNNESTLQSLLCHAARHKIEDMEFDFDYFDDDPYEPLMSLPPSLFNSDSLTSLKLTMATDVMFESPPNSIWLPRLKTLHIEWFEDWEQLILSGSCPVLEELILRCRGLNDDIFNDDYIDISIVSAAIKRLTIECSFMSEDSHTSLKVDCSNIQSLNISNWSGCGDIQVCDLYSLAEADIDIDCTPYYKSPLFWKSPDFWKPRNITSPPVLELLGSIRHVKSLKLSSSTVKAIQFLLSHKVIEVDKLPIFYNLTHLELRVGGRRGGLILLLFFLQKSPHLQSLDLHLEYQDYEDMEQYCLKDVVLPPCLEHCLKTFSISSIGTTKEEIDFLRYILENAKVLEHFKVRWHDYYGKRRISVEEKITVKQDLSTLFRSDCLYRFS